MTLSYSPGETFVHKLDARAKFTFQAGFAVSAFMWSDSAAPIVLTGVVALVLVVARLSPVSAIADYRLPLLFLAVSPVIGAVRLGTPWLDVNALITGSLASYRVVLVLALSTVYVRSTPVMETQAAIQRTIPGRIGLFLGIGVSFVLRFLPVLQADLRRVRDASQARLGNQRPISERMKIVGLGGLRQAFIRADRFALALKARCFAWNPTPPELNYSRRDIPVILAAIVMVGTGFL